MNRAESYEGTVPAAKSTVAALFLMAVEKSLDLVESHGAQGGEG